MSRQAVEHSVSPLSNSDEARALLAHKASREPEHGGVAQPSATLSDVSQRPADSARVSATPGFRERYEAALREILSDSAPSPPESPARDKARTKASAWAEAVSLGAVRDRLAAQGRDSTVRAVAREVGSANGRVGELLKTFEAFPDLALFVIGTDPGSEYEPEAYANAPLRGAERLSQLSFRSLRRVSRIPNLFARAREVRRFTEAPTADVVAKRSPNERKRGH